MLNWFLPYMAGRKRKDIQQLLIRFTKEMNPGADMVLNLLPADDVRVALTEKKEKEEQVMKTADASQSDSTVLASAEAKPSEPLIVTPNEEPKEAATTIPNMEVAAADESEMAVSTSDSECPASPVISWRKSSSIDQNDEPRISHETVIKSSSSIFDP